ASQDYLALSTDPEVIDAGVVALRRFGPHSASSGLFAGDTSLSLMLEEELQDSLGATHVVLFPTGWSAGYGAIAGLVRPDDHVLLDAFAHSCLAQGAATATQNIKRYAHLDNDAVREKLAEIRAADSRNAILVVSEGLYSMNAD